MVLSTKLVMMLFTKVVKKNDCCRAEGLSLRHFMLHPVVDTIKRINDVTNRPCSQYIYGQRKLLDRIQKSNTDFLFPKVKLNKNTFNSLFHDSLFTIAE